MTTPTDHSSTDRRLRRAPAYLGLVLGVAILGAFLYAAMVEMISGPRSVQSSGEDSAAIVMLGFSGAVLFSLWTAVETLVRWRGLSREARRGGLLPAGILVVLLVSIELFVG